MLDFGMISHFCISRQDSRVIFSFVMSDKKGDLLGNAPRHGEAPSAEWKYNINAGKNLPKTNPEKEESKEKKPGFFKKLFGGKTEKTATDKGAATISSLPKQEAISEQSEAHQPFKTVIQAQNKEVQQPVETMAAEAVEYAHLQSEIPIGTVLADGSHVVSPPTSVLQKQDKSQM
eukprot:GDKJ01050866.1.p1 GENE.GDKJ01050866.1~~GDKJ01050866.1.p1  ORF type:complete len:175 (+),score=39.28 GDKJ01050866.1:96-620(+)